jgi:GTP-binding protein EngB required for normal cell division
MSCNCTKNVKTRETLPMNIAEESQIVDDFYDEDDKLLGLCDELNEFANDVQTNKIIEGKLNIELNIPRIVLVGTQSAGKSSFLNKVIGYDLMPTGHNMVTKTPVYVRLYRVLEEDEQYVTISSFDSGMLYEHFRTPISSERLTEDISREFQKVTRKIVGSVERVSNKPIYINVYSQKVFNLTLVDLPGIILMPKTDKGQPASLVNDIKDLINEEVSKENVYVVVCIEAKPDLETDIGLSMIKEIKQRNPSVKAVSLFTKIDMLDRNRLERFNEILGEEMSRDLKTDDGYFVVSNKHDNVDWYYDFLGNKSNIIRTKSFGIRNVCIHLKKKILTSIKRSMPTIRNELITCQNNIKSLNPELSTELKDQNSKSTYITTIVYILSRAMTNSFNSIGHDNNVGYDFKMIFDSFLKETSKLQPFNKQNLSDEKLRKIMDNFDGYLPGSKTTAVSVINKCLLDEELQPIAQIIENIQKCIEKMCIVVLDVEKKFLNMSKLDIHQQELNTFSVPLHVFPNLKEFILKSTKEIIDVYVHEAMGIIKNHIHVQARQIWIDKKDIERMYSPTFSLSSQLNENENPEDGDDSQEDLDYDTYINSSTERSSDSRKQDKFSMTDFKINKNSANAIGELRYLTQICFKNLVKNSQELAIRTIITSIIKKLENHFFLEMTKKINAVDDMNKFFYESDDRIVEFKLYESYMKRIKVLMEKMNGVFITF